ncbi:speriolin-like protein isoform X2 [Cavia porcellus]|uniref:speriolin-like protein isoform X2 n=1 Tax=Cavia porcellus TaxID=10141 RepID=UPI002FE225F0
MIHNQCGVFVCALYVALSLYSQDPACPGHRLGGVREPWLRMRWCCLFKGGDITRPRKVVELWSWLFLLAVGSEFPPPWGCRPAYEYRRLVMAEGSELMNRLMSENADLKKQVRLLKENQMLKRLLSESCQDGGRGARDLLFPKTPPYPEACSPGSGGLDFGRFASVPDAASQLPTSSLEDLLCSHAPLSSEDDASLGCVSSSQMPFKSFLSPPELRTRGDRKLSPLLSPLQDPLADKALLEPREMLRPKKRFRALQVQRKTAESLGRLLSSWTGAFWPMYSQA